MNENIATYTPNIMLKKPGKKQRYDIGVFNSNCDKIDKAIGENKKLANGKEDKGVATQLVEEVRNAKEDKGVAKNLDAKLKTEILNEVLAVKDFPSLKDDNGWMKLPNGMVIQWGRGVDKGVDIASEVTFPIAFPNKCLVMQVIVLGPVGVRDDFYYQVIRMEQERATIFCQLSGGAVTVAVPMYLAIGY